MKHAKEQRMAENTSYNVGTFQNFDRETERLRAQALQTWSKEARMLNWYGLRDGMSVLEIGSGPGFITEQLLDLLPSSQITTVELAAAMVAHASKYLGEKGAERLHALHAHVMQTGLLDDSFDFVIGRYFFQHMSDPVAVATEARRLLKPGGKLVMIDVDDGIWGLADPPLNMDADYADKGVEAQAARGGDRLVGRKFLRILADAGFINREFDAVVYHSDMVGERFREKLREMMNPVDMQISIANGVMTREEADEIIAENERWLASEHPMVMYSVFTASGEKPTE